MQEAPAKFRSLGRAVGPSRRAGWASRPHAPRPPAPRGVADAFYTDWYRISRGAQLLHVAR